MEPACVHRSWDVHRRDQRLRRASGRFSGAGLEGFFREIARDVDYTLLRRMIAFNRTEKAHCKTFWRGKA